MSENQFELAVLWLLLGVLREPDCPVRNANEKALIVERLIAELSAEIYTNA